jgi:hypothetical protein
MLEVIFGYIMLGGLISILANKLAGGVEVPLIIPSGIKF